MAKPTIAAMFAALLLIALVPTAQAHDSQPTDDGRFVITSGNLNEPTTTYMKTGLDLIIGEGDENPGGADEELNAHESLLATIVAPGGEEMDCPLSLQHGATNRYSCDRPYYLTEPGQYMLRLVGDIDGSPVDGDYNIAGPVPAYSDHTFPAEADDNGDLSEDMADLQAQIAALEARIAELEAHEDEPTNESNGAPALGFLAGIGVLGAALLVLRRSA